MMTVSSSELSKEPIEIVVDETQSGVRLDVLLAQRFPTYSRVLLRKIIAAGGVQVDGSPRKVAYRLVVGQKIVISLPELPREAAIAEDIPLTVLYEDEYVVAINKPPGMVVHPARGHWSGTLTSALAFHFEQLSECGGANRPGIVHRLDRDTSGVIIVAKTDQAHGQLARQFQDRTTEKEYLAIVMRSPDRDRDIIDHPIGIHATQREKMAMRRDHESSRSAQTFYEVLERFHGFSLLRVQPKTGRTHQIRVHLGSIGCAVLCDRLYGGRARITLGEISNNPTDETELLNRQALHARRLCIAHPITGERLDIEAPLPADLEVVLAALRTHAKIEPPKATSGMRAPSDRLRR